MRPPHPSLFGPQLNPCAWHPLGAHVAPSPIVNKDPSCDGPMDPSSPPRTEASPVPPGVNWLPPPPPQETTAPPSVAAIASRRNH